MPTINTNVQNNKIQVDITQGFIGGLNSFQDQSVIRDSELTEAKNIILSVDGIEPRYGTARYGDTGSDTAIYGSVGYYKSTGTREFLRVSGGRLKKLDSGAWTAVDSTAFANARTVLLQVRDAIYSFNGSDALRKYDGSTITTYTALTTPVGLTVTISGTSGTTTYSYRVSAFNAQGETLACTAVQITDGNATLSTTNYNNVSWTAVAGATGYNVWGRTATGLGETYMSTVYTNSYADKGQDTPSTVILPPEGNNTAGVKAKYACFAISRIFAAGDPDNQSRLYWGGVGSHIDDFSGSLTGGGYADVFKNDGAIIRAIIPFQGGVIVGKDNAIYKFSFTEDGLPKLEEITRSFGMISHYATLHVENDIIFPARKSGRLAFYSLGNQENYTASILRTNELSIKIASNLEDVNLSRLENAEAFYFRNIYGCAVSKSGSTTHDRIWCLDTRFGAWTYWEGLSPSLFVEYTSATDQKLYYAHATDGYMNEMFMSERNDNGTAISVDFATKSFDQKNFAVYKLFYMPVFQFKNVSNAGSLSGDIITDGAITSAQFSISAPIYGGVGFGAMLFGQCLFGEASGGTPTSGESADQLVEIDKIFEARSIKFRFSSSTANMTYKFLSVARKFKLLPSRRLPQTTRVY